MKTPDPIPQIEDRVVRPKEAEKISGFCDVHMRRLEQQGKFPPRFKLAADSGPYGAVGWMLSSLLKYNKERAATAGQAA